MIGVLQMLGYVGLALGFVEITCILWAMARLARFVSAPIPPGPAVVLGAAMAWRYGAPYAKGLFEAGVTLRSEHASAWLAMGLVAETPAAEATPTNLDAYRKRKRGMA